MNEVLLSIIIPCYNSAIFLNRTLTKLFEQGLENCELILVDDGSTDETLSIIKQFANINTDENIVTISQNNQGVSVARNKGIKVAKGQFICFLDSDDELAPNTIDFYKQEITKNLNVEFFSFAYRKKINSKSKVYKMLGEENFEQFLCREEALRRYFLKKFPIHICSIIVNKEFIQKNNLLFSPGIKIGEDTEFIIKALLSCKKVFYCSRVCFLYLVRVDSVTAGNTTYSEANFVSFLVKRKLLERNSNLSIEKDVNFFLDNVYFSGLIRYLKSKQYNPKVTEGFIKNKEIFKRSFTHVKEIRTLIFIMFRYVPIHFLFLLFGIKK